MFEVFIKRTVILLGFAILVISVPLAFAGDVTDGWGPAPTETFGCDAIYICDEDGKCQWVTVCD